MIVVNHYGGKCECCGESNIEFLGIDHIHGGGTQHRKTMGGDGIYRFLIRENFPDGYRLLCHNCNMAKGFYGYCPHERITRKENIYDTTN